MKDKVFEMVKEECKGCLQLKGFRFMCLAVELIIKNDFNVPMMDVYNTIAKEYGVSRCSVERNLRFLVHKLYDSKLCVSAALYELVYKIKNK